MPRGPDCPALQAQGSRMSRSLRSTRAPRGFDPVCLRCATCSRDHLQEDLHFGHLRAHLRQRHIEVDRPEIGVTMDRSTTPPPVGAILIAVTLLSAFWLGFAGPVIAGG